MEINGWKIQAAIQETITDADAAYEAFEANVTQFPNDPQNEDLDDIFKTYVGLQEKVADLKTLQNRYNNAVTVTINGKTQPLCWLLNVVNGAGKAAKLWGKAQKGEARAFGFHDRSVREPGKEYSVRSKSVAHCRAKKKEADKKRRAFAEAIAAGNATFVDFSGIEHLFQAD